MNIFEFLRKPSDYRTEKKVFQLVKHFDDVNPKASQGTYHKKVVFPMLGQVKKDGIFCAVVITVQGAVGIFNRTGKRMTNCARLEEYYKGAFYMKMITAGVYLGELCEELSSLEELSGTINPNRVNPLTKEQSLIAHRMEVFFFDYISVCEFISGISHLKYSSRHAALSVNMNEISEVLPYSKIVDEEALRAFAKMHIDSGEEGAVFKQDVEWKAGAKDWHQMKVVRNVTYDLECIGFEEGAGKYDGLVANLLFRFDKGKTVKAMLGKGWTHADAERMFIDIYTGEYTPIGSIFKVYGLQPSSKNGVIRLPKVGEERFDKYAPDF